ncbi:MAG: hypothetical protein DRP47_05485 [Candidatus Zixiibacteriota bacterium]|nr:MAG: hypothetical protein DRP47_05485 [candidate division Zixibacteria bacterium]
MFGWNNPSVEILTEYPFLTALAVVVLVGLTALLYRRTNPPLPWLIRTVLATLRMVAILALVLALFQPVISFTREYEHPRKISLLLDHSLSMEKTESGKTRRNRIDSLLAGENFQQLSRSAELTTYYLGGNLTSAVDEVESNRTSLGDVLHQLDRLQVGHRDDYWLLFSDGNSNSGRNPTEVATTALTPIISIDMSSGQGSFDIGVTDIEFNPIVFMGRPTEIKVKLNWHDGSGQKVRVELVDSDRIMDAAEFTVMEDGGFGEVTLKLIPSAPGRKLLRVQVPSLPSEETDDNNSLSFAVKVLKSRLMVLLVSESPDYEIGFLRRFFEQSDRFEVELIATGPNAGNLTGRFPSRQAELNRYDLVIFHDPDPNRLESRSDLIKSYLEDRGGAIWVLMGRRFAARGPCEWFNNLLPFHQSSREEERYIDYHGEPQEDQLYHPAVRLAEESSSIREIWASLPPFEKLVPCDRIAPEGVILVRTSLRTRHGNLPVIGYRRHGPGKLLAQAALPFWTWGFVTLGLGHDEMVYHRFVDGVAGWLTLTDDLAPIRIAPVKRVFTRGEPVHFDGYAFDPGFRPIDGVTGSVTLEGAGQAEPFVRDLINRGEGTYRAVFENPAPGRYSYQAVIQQNGHILKTDEGEILVESFSIEEFDRSGKPSELAAISRLSGGNYFTYEEFDQALSSMDIAQVTEQEDVNITFFNKLWLLLVFTLALSMEWLIRKTNQLV